MWLYIKELRHIPKIILLFCLLFSIFFSSLLLGFLKIFFEKLKEYLCADIFKRKRFEMNKELFKSSKVDVTDTLNNAGGKAYNLSDKAALAQLVCTGTFNNTFYTSADEQLNKVLELCKKCDLEYVAKLAIYARQNALMKDSPAVLAAYVASQDSKLLACIFSRVINNPKMFRNFVKVIRSGVTGRKSFGSLPKKLLQNYLESLSDEALFNADIGNDPTLQDCLKMIRPKPKDKHRAALYGYLLNREHCIDDLNPLIRQYESFKREMGKEIPDVGFQKLTALPLKDKHWNQIAKNATWNQIRQNLNTFARHGVFNNTDLVTQLAAKLEDKELIRRAKVFPYSLFTTFQNMDNTVPTKITVSLQRAAEHSLENIPEFKGKVYVMVDTSGSMLYPVTGNRGSVSSKTRCIDAAALIASAIMRKNPDAEILPFSTHVHNTKLNPLDSIMTNAQKLAALGGGGTNCAAPLELLNSKKISGENATLIMVSDNESWHSTKSYPSYAKGTNLNNEWLSFKKRNPNSKLILIDLTPNTTVQSKDNKDVLNLGGFSDDYFNLIAKFVEFGNNANLWTSAIESVKIQEK